MNNKEFISELSKQIGKTEAVTTKMVNALEDIMVGHFEENDSLTVSGFGAFEVRKKMERISVNPSTGKRYLVPPKLTLNFRQSNALKDKFNS